MNLEGILNVSGKAGLFKIISQSKQIVIIESLTDGKRSPLQANSQANMLEEISIYTYDDTKPLKEILNNIAKKENGKQAISHKSPKNELISYFRDILDNYDEERVYISDIKKVIQWYNIMQRANLIKVPQKEKNPTKEITEIKK